MKKEYSKPNISIFSTRTHISTVTSEEPEDFRRSRRNLLIRGGLIATAGHISLYGGTEIGPTSTQQRESTNKVW